MENLKNLRNYNIRIYITSLLFSWNFFLVYTFKLNLSQKVNFSYLERTMLFLWRPKELIHQKIQKIINDFSIITGHRFCIWMKWTGNGIWSICGSHNDNFLQCLAYTDGLATETKNHYSILYINGGTESRHVDVYISPLRIKGHTQYWWCEMA